MEEKHHHKEEERNGGERKIKWGIKSPEESNVIGREGKECFQKERMWLAMAKDFYFCQNFNFSFAFCIMFIFNKCCINICISNCNKNLILPSAWAKLSMIVSTVLNSIFRLNKGD